MLHSEVTFGVVGLKRIYSTIGFPEFARMGDSVESGRAVACVAYIEVERVCSDAERYVAAV